MDTPRRRDRALEESARHRLELLATMAYYERTAVGDVECDRLVRELAKDLGAVTVIKAAEQLAVDYHNLLQSAERLRGESPTPESDAKMLLER